MGKITRSHVESALKEVREFILSDGGDIEIVRINDSKVFVKLKGACVGCPLSAFTIQLGVERPLTHISENIRIIDDM